MIKYEGHLQEVEFILHFRKKIENEYLNLIKEDKVTEITSYNMANIYEYGLYKSFSNLMRSISDFAKEMREAKERQKVGNLDLSIVDKNPEPSDSVVIVVKPCEENMSPLVALSNCKWEHLVEHKEMDIPLVEI